MKRVIILILCVAMSINLCGCGKGKQVEAAEAAIEAIGDVTLESGEAIEAARTAYDTLKPRQQEKVENYTVLTDAEAVFGTETAIDAIGEVTIDSGDAVEEARSTYEALTPEQQKMVNNADELYAAEGIFKAETAIEAIGEVTLESGPTIEEARNAYDALTPEQQEAVKSLDILTTAEEEFEFAEFYEANRIKDYIDGGRALKFIEDERTVEEIYNSENDQWGAFYYVYFFLGIYTTSSEDFEGIEDQTYICAVYDDNRIDFFAAYNEHILGIRWWPSSGTVHYGTVKTSLSSGEYMQMLERAGVIDEYHSIDATTFQFAAEWWVNESGYFDE